jgi:hypothetical protein
MASLGWKGLTQITFLGLFCLQNTTATKEQNTLHVSISSRTYENKEHH